MERLPLQEAQERARSFARDVERNGVIPDALDWANPGAAAVSLLIHRRNGWSSVIVAIDGIVAALMAHQRWLDFDAGRAAERDSRADAEALRRAGVVGYLHRVGGR